MLCYSFISHCCPLVLIMVGSFKLEIGMLQKQCCPFCALSLFLWDFAHGGKGVYVCISLSVCLSFGLPPSSPICLFACVHTFL